jgi:RNA polymerase sigma-70 factor (ECF subfamily)
MAAALALDPLAPARPRLSLAPRQAGPAPEKGGRGRAATSTRLARVLLPDELEAERELCEKAKGGDRDALGRVLATHGPRLYRSVLLPRLGNVAAAEEALSLTYVRVVERIDRFTWQGVGFYPWFRVLGLRVALDQARSRKRERLFDSADLEREVDDAEREARDAAALEAHDLAVSRERVVSLLGRIHPRYAQAIRLRVLDERPRVEAAAELGVAVGTFDVVLHRAMAALRKVLVSEKEAP